MPAAARVGDDHKCPWVDPGPKPHVGGPILAPCSTDVEIEFMPAARATDKATCAGPPDILAMGCPTVLINNQLAVRVGDLTAHGGVVTKGAVGVEIGMAGDGVAVIPIASPEEIAASKAESPKGKGDAPAAPTAPPSTAATAGTSSAAAKLSADELRQRQVERFGRDRSALLKDELSEVRDWANREYERLTANGRVPDDDEWEGYLHELQGRSEESWANKQLDQGNVIRDVAGFDAAFFVGKDAEAFAIEYGENDPGKMNALQHAYWQAEIRRSYGEDAATAIGDQHEKYQSYGNRKRLADTLADQHNNKVGRSIGATATNEAEVRESVLASLRRGDLSTEGPGGPGLGREPFKNHGARDDARRDAKKGVVGSNRDAVRDASRA